MVRFCLHNNSTQRLFANNRKYTHNSTTPNGRLSERFKPIKLATHGCNNVITTLKLDTEILSPFYHILVSGVVLSSKRNTTLDLRLGVRAWMDFTI